MEPHENGVDVDNDDDMPIMGDLDGMDGDPNDMGRPRKIRRYVPIGFQLFVSEWEINSIFFCCCCCSRFDFV